MDVIGLIATKPQVEKRQLKDPRLDIYSYDGYDFAVVHDQQEPLKISLRCDPVLSRSLQEQYESIMAGHNLDPSQWITVLLTEQIPDDLIIDLINYAYHSATQPTES